MYMFPIVLVMETYLKKLFTDFCNRGCIIDVREDLEYATEHLPKCLISINHNISDGDFIIKSIITSNTNYIIFRGVIKYIITKMIVYCCSAKKGSKSFRFSFDLPDYCELVDPIVYYVFNGKADKIDLGIRLSEDRLGHYKKILKNKMIQNLTEMYLEKYLYFVRNMLPIIEINIFIIEIIIKLDKWYNLEIF